MNCLQVVSVSFFPRAAFVRGGLANTWRCGDQPRSPVGENMKKPGCAEPAPHPHYFTCRLHDEEHLRRTGVRFSDVKVEWFALF